MITTTIRLLIGFDSNRFRFDRRSTPIRLQLHRAMTIRRPILRYDLFLLLLRSK